MTRQKIEMLLYLWKELSKENIEITFEDGVIHKLNDGVEIVYNHDNVSECFNP